MTEVLSVGLEQGFCLSVFVEDNSVKQYLRTQVCMLHCDLVIGYLVFFLKTFVLVK